MGETVRVTIGDAMSHVLSRRGKSPILGPDGVRLVSALNVKGGRIDRNNLRYVPHELYDDWMPEKLQMGDVLLTSEAPLGEVAYIGDDSPLCLGQRLFALRGRPDLLHGRFLYYLLGFGDPHQEILNRATGSTVGGIRLSELLKVTLVLPPISEQRLIAEVLGALDDKIESNRRAMDRLDALFLLECESLLAENGTIDVKRLADLADLTLGGTPSRSNPLFWNGGDIAWINSGCLHERPVLTPADRITRVGLDRSATKLVPSGATVVAITGATLGVVSRLGSPAAINQSVVAVSADDRSLNTFLYFWIRSNIGTLVSSATGAAQQHVNKSNFEELLVEIPSDPVLSMVGERTALLDHEVALARESDSLKSVRDALLPELLSGRLRVHQAEEMVGSV